MTDTAHGFFISLSDLQYYFGVDTVVALSDPHETGQRIDENIQMAIDTADAAIFASFMQVDDFVAPLQPIGDSVDRVKKWAIALAGYWLSSLVGSRDLGGDFERYVEERDLALADMAAAKTDSNFTATRRPLTDGWRINPTVW